MADEKKLSDIFEMSKGYRRGMARVDYLKAKKKKVEDLKAKKSEVKEEAEVGQAEGVLSEWDDITEMAFKNLETGEDERRTVHQARLGKHINKSMSQKFGRGTVDVYHHPKGGLVVQHQSRDEFHTGKMSAHMDELGVPHQHEKSGTLAHSRDRRGLGPLKHSLYVMSSDADDHGRKLVKRPGKGPGYLRPPSD